jgi:hypothetical protein
MYRNLVEELKGEYPKTTHERRRAPLPGRVALALAGALAGCSTSLADQDVIRKAWAERDAERAVECYRRVVAGGCATGGP